MHQYWNFSTGILGRATSAKGGSTFSASSRGGRVYCALGYGVSCSRTYRKIQSTIRIESRRLKLHILGHYFSKNKYEFEVYLRFLCHSRSIIWEFPISPRNLINLGHLESSMLFQGMTRCPFLLNRALLLLLWWTWSCNMGYFFLLL